MKPDTLHPGPTGRRSSEQARALEKRDWELWSIALILLTVLAGGVVTFAYLVTRGEEQASPWVVRLLWLLLFGLIALVLLLNIYLIDKKRTLSKLWRRTFAQEIELEDKRTQAVTDPVTHVHNRRFLDEILPKEARRAERANRPLTMLLVKLDHLRQINVALGHLVGDEVLRQVADTLRNSLRASDYVFRSGGDDFLILLPETDGAATAIVTQRLQQALAAREDLHQRVGRPVTVTIGPATLLPGRTLDSVIEEAQAKLGRTPDPAPNMGRDPTPST